MRKLMLVVLLGAVGCGAMPGQCRDAKVGGPFCVPDAGGLAAAGQAITLEIVDVCNGSCGTKSLSCTVARDAGSISLSLTGQICDAPPGTQCALACALIPHKCELGPLPAGDYTVTSPDQSSQTLHVVEDGGVAGCTATAF